eukprot:4441388-Amphidinium_carterae.1
MSMSVYMKCHSVESQRTHCALMSFAQVPRVRSVVNSQLAISKTRFRLSQNQNGSESTVSTVRVSAVNATHHVH